MATVGISPTSYIGILDRYTKIEGANGEPNPFELVKGTWGLNPRIHLINKKTEIEVLYERMSISVIIPKIKRMLKFVFSEDWTEGIDCIWESIKKSKDGNGFYSTGIVSKYNTLHSDEEERPNVNLVYELFSPWMN